MKLRGNTKLFYVEMVHRIMTRSGRPTFDFSIDKRGVVMTKPIEVVEPPQPCNWRGGVPDVGRENFYRRTNWNRWPSVDEAAWYCQVSLW